MERLLVMLYQTYKRTRICEIAITFLILSIIALLFSLMLLWGISKEVDRMDAQKEYFCEYYGNAINKHYGHDVCLVEQ